MTKGQEDGYRSNNETMERELTSEEDIIQFLFPQLIPF